MTPVSMRYSAPKFPLQGNQDANTAPPEVPNLLINSTPSVRPIGANSDLRPVHNLARDPAFAIGSYPFGRGVDAA